MGEVFSGIEWSVDFNFHDKELQAEIVGVRPSQDIEYAFYLMRGSELVGKVWYSCNPVVNFAHPKIGGQYRVVAFLRKVGSKSPVRKSSGLLEIEGATLYDLSQWKAPVHVHESIGAWNEAVAPADGIHRFPSGAGYIDVRADGMAQLKRGGCVLVCFGGAVPGRVHKTAPFFSGLGVARKSRLPVLAVSDPTLALSNTLALAWYAGNASMPELPEDIARILDSFVDRFGVRLILFGGSGGGFASLSVQSYLDSPSVAFVWNPQTSITEYYAFAVRNFARIAWGAGHLGDEEACLVVRGSCILHDVTTRKIRADQSVLYIQNRSDKFHVENHAARYLKQHGLSLNEDDVSFVRPGLAVWVGDWGKGHAVPPAGLIVYVLRRLGSDGELQEVINELARSPLSRWLVNA